MIGQNAEDAEMSVIAIGGIPLFELLKWRYVVVERMQSDVDYTGRATNAPSQP